MLEGQTECGHCGVPFFPSEKHATVQCPSPRRDNEIVGVGVVNATTCTSCGRPNVKFIPTDDQADQEITEICVYPLSPEQSIEVVIQIILNFADAKSREETGEPLSEEVKAESEGKMRDFLTSMVPKGGRFTSELLARAPQFKALVDLFSSGGS